MRSISEVMLRCVPRKSVDMLLGCWVKEVMCVVSTAAELPASSGDVVIASFTKVVSK